MGACCESNPDRKAVDLGDPSEPKWPLPNPETQYLRSLNVQERKEVENDWKKVDEIWDKFDENKNGVLDKDEAFMFLRVMINEHTGREADEIKYKSYKNHTNNYIKINKIQN